MRPELDMLFADAPGSEELDAHGPRHPAEVLTGCRLTDSGEGWAKAVMPVPAWRGAGAATLGSMGTLAVISAVQALVSKLPDGYGLRTANLRFDQLDHLPPPGSIATGHGESSGVLARSGLSRSTLSDLDDRAFAVCTGRFVVVPAVGVTTPDSGIDQDRSHRPHSMREIVGVQETHAETDKITITIRPSNGLCNQFGIVHGGFHITLIDYAMRAVLSSTRPDHYEALDLSLVYHRPASLHTEPNLILRAVIDRRGRRITTVTASIASGSGLIYTTAHGTFMSNGDL
ncbi:PaaI family thioesterase [Arthrobacter sp. KNU40]|uniref:PaaI family thioesterase n=1 Tax=Arthrobacter sp. KNU40 TaxID=3447965 RepID=UPI003F614A42